MAWRGGVARASMGGMGSWAGPAWQRSRTGRHWHRGRAAAGSAILPRLEQRIAEHREDPRQVVQSLKLTLGELLGVDTLERKRDALGTHVLIRLDRVQHDVKV